MEPLAGTLRFRMVVLPEGTGTGTRRPRTGRTTLLAVLAVVAGLVTLAVLTRPDPETIAAATTTTATTTTVVPLEPPIDIDSFSIGQIATGEPLQWEQTGTFHNIYWDGLTTYDGAFYLFGPASPTFADREEGLRAWRSADGVEWENLDVVIGRDALIGSVQSTPLGLVAMESAPVGDALRLWLSSNGQDWTARDIPAGIEHEHVRAYLTAASAIKGRLIVAVHSYFDPTSLIEDHLRAVGIEADLHRYGWGVQHDPELAIAISAPLGLPALEITADDLGVSEDEFARLTGSIHPPPLATWILDESRAGWSPVDLGSVQSIDQFILGPDETVIAHGLDLMGPATWHTIDGVVWERSTAGRRFPIADGWGDKLVATRVRDVPELVVSSDGEFWEPLGLEPHFPRGTGQWHIWPLAAGEGGIAVGVDGWRDNNDPVHFPGPHELTTDSGATLSLNFSSGEIALDTGEEIHRWRMYMSIDEVDGIDVDLVRETVTFTDPQTGDVLTTLSFAELAEVEASYWGSWPLNADRHLAFAFTPDGENWTIQDARAIFGPGAAIAQLEVTDRWVVAIVGQERGHYETWTAPIP
jgi:hypothetical protein